jgi:hypothetical protein
MNPPRTESGVTEWTERYERLRQHALGGPAPTLEGLPGLAVLLQRGVAVWMQAGWADDLRPERMEMLPPCGNLVASQKETLLVLAAMTLPQLRQFNRRN